MKSENVPLRREDVPFTWSAGCGMPAYATFAQVPYDRLFLSADAIIEAYTKGRPMAEELFGPEIGMGGPTWAGISYGHASCLGSKLIFPADSEVAHTPIYGSLAEAIAALERPIDFSTQGVFPFYLDLWEKLKRAFPREKISFHLKAEGPLTTGWILRGHEFLVELLLEPEQVRAYLRAATASTVAYSRVVRRVNGLAEMSPEVAGVADDIAAMAPPDRWPELVMPFLEQYYTGLTTGLRNAHIEDLTVHHLPYLDQLGLSRFDPSVSPKLTPRLLRDHCRVPFLWRLNSTHYDERTPADIERWVFEAAADGASGVFTGVAREMCYPEKRAASARKVQAFARAAKQVKALLDSGCPREELLRHLK
jgi:hypothetical protein